MTSPFSGPKMPNSLYKDLSDQILTHKGFQMDITIMAGAVVTQTRVPWTIMKRLLESLAIFALSEDLVHRTIARELICLVERKENLEVYENLPMVLTMFKERIHDTELEQARAYFC